MISFHRDTANIGNERAYFRDFEWADVADFHRLARAVSTFVWSPCRWVDGRRLADNFLEARLIGLDFDNGAMTVDQALRVFCDSAHIIGVTKSHQKEKGGRVCDRFRVVLRLDRPVTDVRVYRSTVSYYIDKYDCDSACKDGARFFWPCARIISIEEDGYDQELKNPPPQKAPRENLYRKYGVIRRRTIAVLTNGFVKGSRNADWFMVAKDLLDAGRSEAEVLALITAAPPYYGTLPPEDEEEVRRCICQGIDSVESGKAYGRDQG